MLAAAAALPVEPSSSFAGAGAGVARGSYEHVRPGNSARLCWPASLVDFDEGEFEHVYFCDGSRLQEADLRRAGLLRCMRVVIMQRENAPGPYAAPTQHGPSAMAYPGQLRGASAVEEMEDYEAIVCASAIERLVRISSVRAIHATAEREEWSEERRSKRLAPASTDTTSKILVQARSAGFHPSRRVLAPLWTPPLS